MSDRVRIYSAQHGAYWCPDGHGYTTDPEQAWITTREEAEHATGHCGPEKMIELWPVADDWMTRKELEDAVHSLREIVEESRACMRDAIRMLTPHGAGSQQMTEADALRMRMRCALLRKVL